MAVLILVSRYILDMPKVRLLYLASALFCLTLVPDLLMLWVTTLPSWTISLALSVKGLYYISPSVIMIYLQEVTPGPRLAFEISSCYATFNVLSVMFNSIVGGYMEEIPLIFPSALMFVDTLGIVILGMLIYRDLSTSHYK
ncbi:hypothetical protein KIPB_006459 [Kipferlia bialata]|uniref:Uncharacterized protein n=1 Tax=Kipferlia bialata TaxID=797122 RepID=A0A9K3CZN6_9EUKA|nr:hypothetical protein KIPB_006459 [Kipferlia bialata]|eukprot:g6459.t1